jgi:hypothetical protein
MWKTSKPRANEVSKISMFCNPKGDTNCNPHQFSYWTIKKEILLQKQQRVHPFHCLLAKLSLVKITPFHKYQINILIFRGIFAFHVTRLRRGAFPTTRSLYMAFTEKLLDLVHMNVSVCSPRRTLRILPTNCNHLAQLSPTKALLKEIFNGVVLSTWATIAFFFPIIL